MESRRRFLRELFSLGTTGLLGSGMTSWAEEGLGHLERLVRPGYRWQSDGAEGAARKIREVSVGIARGGSVKESVAKAVELGGGLGFIKAGTTVLVKPNVNSDDPYPGTTNPEVLYHLLELIREKDPKRVIVSDRSGYWGKTVDFMKRTGIYEASIKGKAEVIPFDAGPWVRVKPVGADSWKNGFRIPELIRQADSIICVPVCKTHKLATFTMAIKNFVGFLHPEERTGELHKSHSEPSFGNLIAELGLACDPDLYVMDATKVFVSGGPARGDERKVDLVVATRDRVANDVIGLALLKFLGTEERIEDKSVWEQPQIRKAIQLGLGIASRLELKVRGYNFPESEEIIQYLS